MRDSNQDEWSEELPPIPKSVILIVFLFFAGVIAATTVLISVFFDFSELVTVVVGVIVGTVVSCLMIIGFGASCLTGCNK